MSTIPTAEEMMQSKNGDDYTHWEEIHSMMIEFAKLHVEAALKQASENVVMNVEVDGVCGQTKYYDYAENDVSIDTDSIINAYPLKNIK